MANPAFYDFFRKIVLQPDGVTLEADSVTDTLTITGGTGVELSPNESNDSFNIGVDYQFAVPIGTTDLQLTDINSNDRTITLTAGNNITLTRVTGGEIRIDADDEYVLGDIQGSVFADDSTLLVDGVSGAIKYYPTTPSDWDGTAPTSVGEALDRLAVVVKALNAGTGA
jgi:hypothetical protein